VQKQLTGVKVLWYEEEKLPPKHHAVKV